jgi:hypothetical protein
MFHVGGTPAGLRDGPPSTINDRVFENELNIAVFRAKEAYDKLLFREALKCAGYDLGNARDVYRCACMYNFVSLNMFRSTEQIARLECTKYNMGNAHDMNTCALILHIRALRRVLL